MSDVFELKQISTSGIAAALERAERYRLLNEPSEAESICLDVLEIDPENQRALVILILGLTDQFAEASKCLPAAKELLEKLQSEYEREYYCGVICERKGKVILGFAGGDRRHAVRRHVRQRDRRLQLEKPAN